MMKYPATPGPFLSGAEPLSCYCYPGPPLCPSLNLQTIFSFKSFLPTSFCPPHSKVTPALCSHGNPNSSPFFFTSFLSIHLHFGESHLFGGPKPTVSPLKWAFQEDAGSLLISQLDILARDPPSISKGSPPPMVFISFLPFVNSPGLGSFEISFSSTLGNLTHFSWEIKSKLETGEPAQRKDQKMIAYT